MHKEEVAFAFFIVLALTINFGFFWGEIDNLEHHNRFELFAALFLSFIATILKFGDNSPIGSLLLATSLVADLQLLIAAGVWWFFAYTQGGLPKEMVASIVSLSAGAVIANAISVILLMIDTLSIRR